MMAKPTGDREERMELRFLPLACLVCCCCLLGLSAVVGASRLESEIEAGARVGVIGAGPAGLFTARLLKLNGYEVTVLEAQNKVGGLADDIEINGQKYDWATQSFPAQFLNGKPYEPFFDLLEEYQIEKVGFNADLNWATGDGSPSEQTNIPPFQSDYDVEVAVQQALEGWLQLKRYFTDEPGVAGVRSSPAVGQTFQQWAKVQQVEYFGEIAAAFFDVYLAGPAFQTDAAYVLKASQFHLVPFYRTLLSQVPEEEFNRVTQLDPVLKDIAGLEGPKLYLLKEGFKAFFQTLVDIEDIDVRLSEPVTSISSNKNGEDITVEVTTSQDTYTFDALVVSTAPEDALSFLPNNHDIRPYFENVTRNKVRSLYFQNEPHLANDGQVYVVPERALHPDTPTDLIHALFRPYPQNDITAGFIYVSEGSTDTEQDIEDDLTTDINDRSSSVVEYYGHKDFEWPSKVPTEATGLYWFEEVDALQGKGNVFFVGETFSGAFILPIMDHIHRIIPTYFDGIEQGIGSFFISSLLLLLCCSFALLIFQLCWGKQKGNLPTNKKEKEDEEEGLNDAFIGLIVIFGLVVMCAVGGVIGEFTSNIRSSRERRKRDF
ncbi:hypothetical protein QOT17_000884 [Balamuthia mandrillaris]